MSPLHIKVLNLTLQNNGYLKQTVNGQRTFKCLPPRMQHPTTNALNMNCKI